MKRCFYWFIILVLMNLVISVGISSAKEVRGMEAEASSYKEWGAPELLVDGDKSTAWVGGRKGVGPGKTLSFTLQKKTTITMIQIANGNQGEDKFNEFRCITRGVLVLPDNGVHYFTLKPEAGEQQIIFPPVSISSFTIIIDEVFPASEETATDAKVAVSEIRAFTNADKASLTTSQKPAATEAQTSMMPKVTATTLTATKPGRLYLQTMVPVPPDSAMKPGIIAPETKQVFIDLIQNYFSRLATLQDNYIDIFAASIKQREQAALARFKAKATANIHFLTDPNAVPDSKGISVAKPIIRGHAAMVSVHGNYRITSEGKLYESRVNALFSFIKENGTWLINGVQKR